PPGSAVAGRPVRVGVARDRAFQFYYAENLDLLRRAGAELVFWSPMDDATLPEVDGLFFGGGYPEIHAERLSANAAMRQAVRKFAEAGRPVYAECGGLMYLAESLQDAGGSTWPMAGLLPARTRWVGLGLGGGRPDRARADAAKPASPHRLARAERDRDRLRHRRAGRPRGRDGLL